MWTQQLIYNRNIYAGTLLGWAELFSCATIILCSTENILRGLRAVANSFIWTNRCSKVNFTRNNYFELCLRKRWRMMKLSQPPATDFTMWMVFVARWWLKIFYLSFSLCVVGFGFEPPRWKPLFTRLCQLHRLLFNIDVCLSPGLWLECARDSCAVGTKPTNFTICL